MNKVISLIIETHKNTPQNTNQSRPTRSFEAFFRHVKRLGFDPAICIDVGAADGTGVIYEAFPQALHIVFEPLPEFQKKLADRLRNFKHEIYHCALMDHDGEMEILRTQKNIYGSSLMHKGLPSDDPRLIQVPVCTLDAVIGDREITGPVLLKTDCQGSDLMVIKGAPKTLDLCELVILECSLFRFWGDHHPDFTDIVQYMNAKDFVVYDILDGLFRPSDEALGQLDIVFTKRNSFLRRSRKW